MKPNERIVTVYRFDDDGVEYEVECRVNMGEPARIHARMEDCTPEWPAFLDEIIKVTPTDPDFECDCDAMQVSCEGEQWNDIETEAVEEAYRD